MARSLCKPASNRHWGSGPVASRQRQTEVAGLGLAIVKSIVEAHEGRIDISSVYGLMSCTICLPRTA
ncbi:MAG: hypothetical protein P8176_00250 [Gammaproteobacteria bacterium]